MAELQFRVLGPVEMLRHGQPVVMSGGTTVNLVAGLLMSAGRPVTHDALASMVWGAELPEHPRSALQSLVSRLRGVLGPDAVQTHGRSYQIRVDPDTLDLLRFDQLAGAAEAALSRDSVTAAVASLDEALDLWNLPVLANVSSESLYREGTRLLTERYLGAQEKRADLRLRLGQHRTLITELTALTSLHPLREDLIGQLMIALYRCDRQAEALATYHEVRLALRDDLGVDPSEALQKLQLSILRRDCSLDRPLVPACCGPAHQAWRRPPQARRQARRRRQR
jgi:DNA-binding SARP family transcriptional activator